MYYSGTSIKYLENCLLNRDYPQFTIILTRTINVLCMEIVLISESPLSVVLLCQYCAVVRDHDE